MKKNFLFLFVLSLFFPKSIVFAQTTEKRAIDYVDMFVGTSNSRPMLGPYASVPYGMVQLGPDNQDTHWMGGYEYSINNVKGFAHIHAWMMGGLMIMPSVQDLVTWEGTTSSPYRGANAGYHSRILKDTEKGEPGYYSVFLYDADCLAEVTATNHCGFHKYTFANDYNDARVLLDLNYPTEYGMNIHEGYFKIVSDNEIEGYADTRSAGDYVLHYNIRFNKPFKRFNGWHKDSVVKDVKEWKSEGDCGGFVEFDVKKGESILVQVSLSLVDQQGCLRNFEEELKPYNWDFDAVRKEANNKWNTLLSKIQVEGDELDKEKFYTNLFRAYAKQTWSDVDGRYRDPLERIQKVNHPMYGGDAFWNSFWNYNPLLALISPDILNNWVLTQLELFDKTGWTNNGPTGLEHTGIMEVTHEIALMVGAYQKGIRNYDVNKLWNAVRHNATEQGAVVENSGWAGQRNLNVYKRLGYVPVEKSAACQTLDYAYTDFCTAQLAKALGKKKDYNYFLRRSNNWKNQFNVETKWQTPKDSMGNWIPNYDILSGYKWIEGNGWQYTWYVPHDVPGLIKLMGKDLFNERLEEGFEKSVKHRFAAHAFDRHQDVAYEYYINQGNEGNMQAAYLFNYSGKPWLTQKYTRSILDIYYGNHPYDGWQGDEDEGQMGAWFVMSALGLFEMNGGVTENPEFDLTSPLFSKAVIYLDSIYGEEKIFTIVAKNNSKENIYIQSANLNGKPLNRTKLKWSDVINGGKLVFEMGNHPNQNWGK
ncbi:GH92 family glycosyl hydrolase [Phocaeicola sartorii]|uniref:GH92 family glycosyl hydrolase n=1 Tax=Phocaeicola sartorii TaxID=671267 RepID=UPI0021A98116|nr:GH92 family glycosyl hydrolase [Phocaeicola sartorii]